VSLTKSFRGFCGRHISFSKQLEKHLKKINRGQTVERPIRAVERRHRSRISIFSSKLRVRSLFKIVAAAFVKIQYSKILGVNPAFPFLDIVIFLLTEAVIISVAPNFGKLYGRMRKIAQAFARARSGIKMAG